MSAQLLQVNYKFAGTQAEFEQGFGPKAAEIAQVPGLRWKVWIFNEEQSCGGGIYLFDDQSSLGAFLEGPIVAALKSHPAFSDISVLAFDVLAEPTAITRGPVA